MKNFLSQNDVEQYDRDGFVLVNGLFNQAEVAAMLREVEGGSRVADMTRGNEDTTPIYCTPRRPTNRSIIAALSSSATTLWAIPKSANSKPPSNAHVRLAPTMTP